MLILATDVKNAFPNTDRDCQIFEFLRYGENDNVKILIQTFTLQLTFSSMTKELRGSRQGGLKSPPDFKLFCAALNRLIVNSGLGLKVENNNVSFFLCADDNLACTGFLEDLKGIAELYEWYSNENLACTGFLKI